MGSIYAVLADEEHLHLAVRGFHLHADVAAAADLDVHLGLRDSGAHGAIPVGEVLGLGPHRPDQVDGSVEGAFDLDVFGVGHMSCLFLVLSVLQVLDVVVQAVESVVPDVPVLLSPVSDFGK